MTPESQLKSEVAAYLAQMPKWWVILRLNSGKVRVKGGFMQLCPEGTSDYLICNPDPHWLELKAAGNTTKASRREAQEEFGARVVGLGHKYRICTSVEEVRAFLEGVEG